MVNNITKIWMLIGVLALIILTIIVVPLMQKPKAETVKIGAVLPLTGVESRQGELIRNSILMAQEEINAEGGINDKMLQIVLEDDKSEPRDAVTAYNALQNVHDTKIILTIGSPIAMSLAPLANTDDVVLFSIAAAPAYSSPDDYTYRVIPSAVKEGKDMAELLVNKLNTTELAVVYLNNDYGLGTKEAFVKPFIDLGGEIIIEEAFDPSETDFRTQLLKIQSKNPEVVYVASWGKQAGMLVRQAHEMGMENVQFFGGQAWHNPDFIEEGGKAVEGAIYTYPYFSNSTAFFSSYLEKYGEESTQISERMYDIVKLSAEIIETCGIENNACLLSELQKTEFQGSSSIIRFDNNGDVVEDFVLYIVKNGRFVPYQK